MLIAKFVLLLALNRHNLVSVNSVLFDFWATVTIVTTIMAEAAVHFRSLLCPSSITGLN
jgi:hypothetical protein